MQVESRQVVECADAKKSNKMSDLKQLQLQLEAKEAEFEEFQRDSQEYERELEQTVEKYERQIAEANAAKSKLELDMQALRERTSASTQELNRQLHQLQEEYQKVLDENRSFKQVKTQLEMDNDQLEQNHRVESSSRTDLEQNFNKLVEKLALLEAELEQQKQSQEVMQRLRDELRDAHHEIAVLQAHQKSSSPAKAASSDIISHDMDKLKISPLSSPRAMADTPAMKLVQDIMNSVKTLELRLNNCRDLVSPMLSPSNQHK